MSRPWLKFFVGDWLNRAALRSCSRSARGLAIDLLALMHQGEPYGHLRVGKKDLKASELARIVGGPEAEVESELLELLEAGVFARTPEGRIYSPRMVRDEEQRLRNQEHGSLGGNPSLKGDAKPTDNQGDRQGDNPAHARAGSEVRGQKLELPAANRPRRPKAESGRGQDHAEAVEVWCRTFEEQTGRAYPFQGPIDGKQVQKLVRFPDFTLEELKRRAGRFCRDPYWKERGIDLKRFVSQWTALGNAGGNGRPAPQTMAAPSSDDLAWCRRALRDPDTVVQDEARRLMLDWGLSEVEVLGGQS